MSIQRLITSVSIVVVLAVLAACNVGVAETPNGEQRQANVPLPVQVVIPEITDLFAKYFTSATITTDLDAPIAARAGGEVVEILVEEGDWVEKGTLLARLDGDRLRIQVSKSKAALEKTIRKHTRLVDLHARGLVSTATLDELQFDMLAQRAAYELAQLNYEYSSIRATIPGFISERNVKIGQHLLAGDSAFRITDPSELIAHLHIPQIELARFSVGQDISVQVDSMPEQRFAASVARVSPTIDPRDGTFRATATIDNTAGLLTAGMFGRFEIAYELHASALVIPTNALLTEDNVSVVYIVRDGAAVRRKVTPGITDGDRIEILHGINANDQIIVSGQNGLADGSRVLASRPQPTPAIG